jgi:hypothetical protein
MDFDPRTWGSGEWSLAVAIVGLLFAFVQPFGFLLQWRKDSEDRLEKNAKPGRYRLKASHASP